MSENLQELVRFRVIGERSGLIEASDDGREGVSAAGLQPALLAPFTDLANLRYDFPLVLVEGEGAETCIRTLSSVIDGLLQKLAPRGIEGERLRKHLLHLEAAIRALSSQGVEGSLSELWNLAKQELLSETDEVAAKSLEANLRRAEGALRIDGRMVDCDEEVAARLLTHVWTRVQGESTRRISQEIDELTLKLSEVLAADFAKSQEAHAPAMLEGSLGAASDDTFDFEAMSRILAPGSSAGATRMLPQSRQERIQAAIAALRSQRFFAAISNPADGEQHEAPYSFVFGSCTRAVEAFRERLPDMVELVKAMAIAELEIENRYSESAHDSFFERFGERSLSPEDLALFPSYLVCLHDKDCDAREQAEVLETLSSGLPINVLIETNDLLGDPTPGDGRYSLGVRGLRLAKMAVGLGDAYVLQSASSNLVQAGERILEGLRHSGPALFRVFSGSLENSPGLPSYLTAASALQSRAFATFSYHPAAGSDWASRFHIEDNPQVDLNWPIQSLSYEDGDLQRVSEDLTFTFIDFVATDRRYAGHFARVPRDRWNDGMLTVREYLELSEEEAHKKVPFVWMVDDDGVLHKLVVDDELIRATRRCSETWSSLQELGGIHNSHALRLLERERAAWELEREREIAEREASSPAQALVQDQPKAVSQTVQEPALPKEAEGAGLDAAPAPPRNPDEPSIETLRCTSCDECTQLNDRMFAYDENKQAYIADPDAGTYRDLVEAAEKCQVCIIDPGKPRNPDEPGLADLIARAEAFH